MNEWQECSLADVAEVESGAGFPIQYQGGVGEEFPFLKVSDMNLPGNERMIQSWNNSISEDTRRVLRAKAFPPGALIFPKIGAAIGTNKKRILTRPSCIDNNVMAVIPKPGKLDSDFLYFLLQNKDLTDFASDSNPPSIRKSTVEDWRIEVPSIDEQRRIADILSRAQGIVRLRHEAEKKTADLVQAIFITMFGDPATNPLGLPVKLLGEVIESADYGSSTKASDDGSGVPIIRMGNVCYDGSLDLESLKYVELDPDEVTKYRLVEGDILFNRTNSKELVGKTGLWDGSCDAIAASYFIRVRVRRDTLNPFYVWAFMNTAHMKRVLFDTARGAIGQANINSKELKAFSIPLPLLERQNEFEQRCREVADLKAQQRTAMTRAEAAFDALLAQAFTNSKAG